MSPRWLILVCAISSACSTPNPVAPTSTAVPSAPAQRTSRVDPNTLEDSVLESLTLDHNPWAPGVSLCRTKLRGYVGANGYTSWEIDYYTVMAPETCPVEPID